MIDIIEKSFNINIYYILKVMPVGQCQHSGNGMMSAPIRTEAITSL